MVIIDDADAATRFPFSMDLPTGAVLALTGDGGARVRSRDGLVLSVIAPPWATDAVGVSVPTRYEIVGTTLVQVVQHEGATYPVVADPWWGAQWKVSGSEASKIGKLVGAFGATATAAAAICTAGIATGFICGLPNAAAAVVVGLLYAFIDLCNWNGKGFNVNKPWVGPVFCTPR